MNNISDTPLETSDNKTGFGIFVRIAVYDSLRSLPRIVDLSFDNVPDFINKTTEEVYGMSHSQGGRIPYTIIKEIIENLIFPINILVLVDRKTTRGQISNVPGNSLL